MGNLIENRQIRVFISSTFQDMQDERDYLMKRTFPKLRKLAAERDVTLTELDLRWGITEEEAKTGKVVEICLREIENSIPFFIGVIGNRYGWVPEKKDIGVNVTERFKDVNNYLKRHLSVTEMEMQFGVLQRKEDMHAYFYIKEGEDKENADNPEMLERLKKEVKASRYPSTTYSSPENLGIQVEHAFRTLLDRIFPEGHLSELEKERIGQRSFMRQLCQNYIRDDKNFQALNEWMDDWEKHQLVVTGASGLGKSSLIANWLKEKLSDENRGYNIIYHFTGNGGSESNKEHIMKVLIDEINDVYGWTSNERPNKFLIDVLKDVFKKVASEGRKPLLIVIDAINQIVDIENAKQLYWLPVPTKNIKILFSTLEDDLTMEVLKNRNYPIYFLKPLTIERRQNLINSYLQLFGKSLTAYQIEGISKDPKCENTLVLKTLLDELINFGVYELLDKYVKDYLSPNTIDDFYQLVLNNYEREFGKEIVEKSLIIISISHWGITEGEIIRIANLRQIDWVTLFCALSSFFTTGNGLITFSHKHFRDAVSKRYIGEKNGYINPFRRKIMDVVSKIDQRRAIYEISFQLYHLNENEKLYASVKRYFDTLITFDEKWASIYVERLLEKGLGSLKEFLTQKGNKSSKVDFWYADFLFSHPNVARSALNQKDGVMNFLKPYLQSSRYYPNCIHKLAEKFESIDINTAIDYYKLEIKYYSERVLLPPPGFLKEEEQMEIWHRIQELKKQME